MKYKEFCTYIYAPSLLWPRERKCLSNLCIKTKQSKAKERNNKGKKERKEEIKTKQKQKLGCDAQSF